jgi:tocopherol cyclase
MIAAETILRPYRALGADPPFGDPRRDHGVGMEGYFWRFSDPRSGRVVVALCGLCRGGDGPAWATVALAGHPGGRLWSADLPQAGADSDALGVWAEGEEGFLRADATSLTVDLGPGARLAVTLSDPLPARRGMLGGCGVAHLVPGLGQYWDPHLLEAEVQGQATIAHETINIGGFRAYGEKNWGRGGFPRKWWWGQAQGFPREDVCVAFAGGEVNLGPVRTEASAIVVGLGEERVRLGNPLLAPARARVEKERWQVRSRGPLWSVELEGWGSPAEAHMLPVPDLGARRSVPAAREHLAARLALVVRRRGRVVYAGESALAGLEVGGVAVAP